MRVHVSSRDEVESTVVERVDTLERARERLATTDSRAVLMPRTVSSS
jgi:hypothetical protein